MTVQLGRPGIGHRALDASAFQAAAAALERLAAHGQARVEHRAAQRRGAEGAVGAVDQRWQGPHASAIAGALRDWCIGAGERVESREVDAYRSLLELAVVARATAEVIARVERFERSWIEHAGLKVTEWSARGALNLLDAIDVVSDVDAQRARELVDAYNRVTEQASAERAQALERWLRAMEASADALQAAVGVLRENTVAVPEAMRPRHGSTAGEVGEQLRMFWAGQVRDGLTRPAVPGLPQDLAGRVREWWRMAMANERAALVVTSPDLVVLLLDVIPADQLTGDPLYGGLYALVLEERARDGDAGPEEWLRRAWIRYPPVSDTVAAMRMAAGGARQRDLAELHRRLDGLSGIEIDAVLAQLSDDELRRLDEQMDESWIKGGLSADEKRAFLNTVAARASLPSMRRLVANGWDSLAPPPAAARPDTARPTPGTPDEFDRLSYRPRTGPLVTDGFQPGDVNQGVVGDCYLIAALQALAINDPGALDRMVRPNPNGTFTVTFGDGSTEIVIPDFAADPAGDLAFARHGPDAKGDLWPMIIEKAYAQRHGGWDAITGGRQDAAVEDLTGRPADSIPARSVTIADLAQRLDRGEILGASTIDAPKQDQESVQNWLRNDAPEPFRRPDGAKLVQNHAFIIIGADPAAGTVTLINPWNPTGGQVVLTEDELRAGIQTIRVNEAP